MRDFVWVVLIGVGAYFVLGLVMQHQEQQAVAACGVTPVPAGVIAPDGTTAAGHIASCPALAAVHARWAWYPRLPTA